MCSVEGWRGFAGDLACFPRSPGRNALVAVVVCVAEVFMGRAGWSDKQAIDAYMEYLQFVRGRSLRTLRCTGWR